MNMNELYVNREYYKQQQQKKVKMYEKNTNFISQSKHIKSEPT